jgi:hypothetical protein
MQTRVLRVLSGMEEVECVPGTSVIARIETRTVDVVVVLGRKSVGDLIGATGRPSAQTGVTTLRAQRSISAVRQARKDRSDKLSIGDVKITAFATFTGFHGFGQ